MKLKLLHLLACPACGKDLKLTAVKKVAQEVSEGVLFCACGESYPIIRGVPRLLLEPLRSQVLAQYPEFKSDQKRALDAVSKEKLDTSQSFGYEWQRFSRMESQYVDQFLDWIWPVKRSFFKGKFVLDAGCGMARHLYCAAMFGAKEAIGIDLGPSVDVAYANTKHISNAHVVQADIYNLPFKNSFDYAYSIGVLHHLPNPEQGFQSVLNKIKKGGAVSAWLYGYEGNWILRVADPVRKFLFSHLPLGINRLLSFLFTLPLYPLLHLVYKPLNERKSLICRFLPQNDFVFYLSKFPFHVVHSIVFDQMLAPKAYYFRKEEVGAWFRRAKLKKVNISWRNRNSWRGYGEK